MKLICKECGSTFERESREYKRSLKKGRRSFCSRRCSGKANIGNIPADKRNTYDITQHSLNRKDKYTGLREFLRRIRNRNKETNLTLEIIRTLWLKKNCCAYSGIALELPKSSGKSSQITTASLDRIDSSKGYIIGNIQFVSIAINRMKGEMSHEETIELCKIIALNYNGADRS